ncbi:MAG: D-glycero-alpha-D-manno-heptose-1,7-bisphosphate 7-phosphatase [bacterium]
MRRAAFIDRDGTLIVDKNYLSDPEQLEWIPGTIEALKKLRIAGFLIYIVSNQSGVARGYFDESAVRAVNERMLADLARAGIEVDGVYYCPYHPRAKIKKYRRDSELRKPGAGMLKKAARQEDIDFAASYMFGDKISDLEAGRKMNCRLVLVETGKGKKAREKLDKLDLTPDLIAVDFPTAVRRIVTPPGER